jgi:hypothetical protein
MTPPPRDYSTNAKIIADLREIGALKRGDLFPEWIGRYNWGAGMTRLLNAAADCLAEYGDEPAVVGKSGYVYVSTYDEIVETERERCAKVAQSWRSKYGGGPRDAEVAQAIAAAIRNQAASSRGR